MDEIWEKAVEAALEGQEDPALTRALTLDGAVKCLQGRLPPPGLLEKFQNLQHLSIANIGVSSLEQFPRLRNLQKLILSDNRIAGGLEFLVEAGLDSLRDLDLSNNRIQYIEDLAPLAQLRLVSLDLYECPVTRVKDYRSRVFGLIKSLKYLDKMDAEENERPETDDEEDEDDDEEEEDDPGSGEIDGDERPYGMNNGHSEGAEGIVDVDEDEESDADEEETETVRRVNGSSHHANGFRIGAVGDGEEDEEDAEDDEDNDSGEEVDDEDGDEDDVVEVHEIDDSDDEDGVEDDDDEDDEDDEEDEEEEVDNEEADYGEPESTGRLTSTEGEIDGHEQGEDDGDEDDGETGEEEQGVEEELEYEEDEEGEEEEEDYGAGYLVQPVGQVEEVAAGGYLVQPVGQVEEVDAGGSDMEAGNEEDEPEEEEEVDDEEEQGQAPIPSTSHTKRKRDESGDEDDEDEDVIEYTKSSSKKHH